MAQYQYERISEDLSRRFKDERNYNTGDARTTSSGTRIASVGTRTVSGSGRTTAASSRTVSGSSRTTAAGSRTVSGSDRTTTAGSRTASASARTAYAGTRTNSGSTRMTSATGTRSYSASGRMASTRAAADTSSRIVAGPAMNTGRSGAYSRYSGSTTPNLTIIEGTAARVLEEPERKERPYEDRKSAQERKNKTRNKPMNLGSLVVLMGLAIVIGVVSVGFLNLQSKVTVQAKNVSTLQKQYEAMVENNDALELDIAPLTDYAYVYKVATEELGMQVPTSDQIKTFNKTEDEYVIQYDQIPEE